MRAGPGYSNYAQTGQLHEGDPVDVVCQTRGETVSQSGWGTSSVWDRLTNASWVTDLYVDTPNINQFSPPIPQC
jgi:LasA protease